jgi:hypothetical protein
MMFAGSKGDFGEQQRAFEFNFPVRRREAINASLSAIVIRIQ